MSGPEAVSYQSEAIEKISNVLSKLLGTAENKNRVLVFKAPTGSGKTLMVGYALSKTHTHLGVAPFIVLWLSPGKGDLHKQSARALTRMLSDSSLDVKLLDSRDDIVANTTPESGTVFVVNWEKLRTEKDGEWANKMLREGETANLFTMLENTTKRGMDMIVVIDESHTNLDGPQTTKLMAAIKEFRPFIQLEASATPTTTLDEELRDEGIHHSVVVPFRKVEEAGMVRKSVLLNPEFENVQTQYPDYDLDIQVLHAAWQRTASLTKSYAAARSPVKPLLLIQYPDGALADSRAEVVEKFLEDQGLVKDVTYATWLSGDHSDDLENISKYTSPYSALIFKQAIATGWDCPRAQVLVQFRVPGSETFQIQTLGRIMRSPEQKHYDDDTLNVAYVYSDLAGVSVRITSDEPEFAVRDLTINRGDKYPATGLKLHSVFQPRRREYHYPLTEHLEPELKKTLDAKVKSKLPAEAIITTPATFLTDATLEFKYLLTGGEAEFQGEIRSGILGEQLVQALYDRALVARIGPYRSREQSRSRIKSILVSWFQSARPEWQPDEIQHFVLQHAGIVSEAIENSCHKASLVDEAKAIADARSKRRISKKWEIPINELVASAKWLAPADAGNLFDPPRVPQDRSKPEIRFEKWLGVEHAAGRITWWWKNGIRDERYLGVEYPLTAQGKSTTFVEICYPDYIVMTTNGTVWAIEVKDIDDPDGSVGGKSAAKAVGLEHWAGQLNTDRETKKEQVDLPRVAACLVVPIDDGHGGVIVKSGSPTSWMEPSKANHAANNGWTDLAFSASK